MQKESAIAILLACGIRKKRITALLLLLGLQLLLVKTQAQTLNKTIALPAAKQTGLALLTLIEKQTGIQNSYDEIIGRKLEKTVPFSKTSATVKEVLEKIGTVAGLTYTISNNYVIFKPVATPAASPQKAPGRVTGKIIDDETGEPLADVSIRIGSKGTTSDIDGSFSISLPRGSYEAEISSIGYGTKQISGIEVTDNQVFNLNVTLRKETNTLSGVVVKSSAKKEGVAALYARQKNNASMTNGISAEQIRVTPDNNVAQVLKRVSGITVQNDKFVTVRGVSDRYNNVLINGGALPSTEPNRRNFSFDIVPSALVDNVVVNKTATPDLPGEFTGGLVQINTRDVPDESFLSVSIGRGFNTESTGRKLISYKRDDKAWMGVVDKNRRYFGNGRLFDPVQYIQYQNNNDTSTLRKIGAAIPNRWQFYKNPYQPASAYQLSGGFNKRFKNSTLGFISALTYLNEQFAEHGEAFVTAQYDFASERYKYNTAVGGLFNMTYKTARHRISWKNLYNKRYTNQFDIRTGNYAAQGYQARRSGEVTLDNRLIQTRVEGENSITRGGIKLEWSADYIQLNRSQPDTRFITARDYGIPGEAVYTYDFNDLLLLLGGLHSSLLTEKRKNAAGNFSMPFNFNSQKQLFKIGYSWSERDAAFNGTNMRILGDNETSYTERLGIIPFHEIVTQEAFRRGYLYYRPSAIRAGSTGDRYDGIQQLQAGYAMLDIKPVKGFRLTGGVRYEENKMDLSTAFYDYTTGLPSFDDSIYLEKDWLPSINLIYSVTEKLNLRGAYSKTLSRPDFVERSPYIYYDFTELAEVFGQRGLKISRIQNYDLRVEYYPSGDEILSASVFYKDFVNPVERFYHIQPTSNRVEYANLYSATARGFEIDVRKSLGFINPAIDWLSRLYISANYTYLKGDIQNRVEVSPITGHDTLYIEEGNRPIQGLSPYIINGGINYQEKKWGFNFAFNRMGRRIVNGGTVSDLIQWENPRSILDAQLNLRLMDQKMEIKFNIGDMLNQPYIIYSNTNKGAGITSTSGPNNDPKGDAFNEEIDLINCKVKKGSNFGINITYKFL